jgi:hypothetical protein
VVNISDPSGQQLAAYWLFVGILGGIAAWYLARHYGRSPWKWVPVTVILGPIMLLVLAAVGRPGTGRSG